MSNGATLTLAENLRQMIAVLEEERRGLAAMDLDTITETTQSKEALCGTLAMVDPLELDAECHGLIVSAKQLNEVNRRVRNLLSANVSARLDALTGQSSVYSAQKKMAAGSFKSLSV